MLPPRWRTARRTFTTRWSRTTRCCGLVRDVGCNAHLPPFWAEDDHPAAPLRGDLAPPPARDTPPLVRAAVVGTAVGRFPRAWLKRLLLPLLILVGWIIVF